MDRAAVEHGAAGKRSTTCRYRVPHQGVYKFGVGTGVRNQVKLTFPQPPKLGALTLTQLCGRPHDGVQHGLQVVGRPADNAEYVAGRGLVIERFRELACALR